MSLEALFNLMLFTNFYLRTYGKNRLAQLGARMGFCDLQLSQAMKVDHNQNELVSYDDEKHEKVKQN